MNEQKIALVVDSCIDVPKHLIDKYGMYIVPLKIIYKEKEYADGIDITPEEVYSRLTEEIPTTSLPGAGEVTAILDRIKADGYEKVLIVTLSSGLSGTCNLMQLVAKEYEAMEVAVVDTLNIGIGAGFNAIMAGEYIAQGMDFATLVETVTKNVPKSKVFFCVSTLEYLQKGGRIGLVASILGTALNLKPIISCNEEGIYYNVAKIRGRKQSLEKVMELAVNYAKTGKRYNVALVHGGAEEEAIALKEKLMAMLPDCNIYTDGQISPALGVHTGPGLIGIAIQLIEN